MNVRATSVAALLSALVLAGCTAAPTAAPVATTTSQPSAARSTSTPTPTPTPTADALAACRLFGDGGDTSLMQRIPASLTGIGAKLDSARAAELLSINRGLLRAIAVAPPALKASLTSLNAPFQQVADVLGAGGGSLSMDTSHVASDAAQVMRLCAEAGYQVS